MNTREKIVMLIKDYKENVVEGVKCLNKKYFENPGFYQTTDDGFIERHGFIESDKKTYYEFHGISGCYVKWQNGKSVDFNLGEAGRCDGFDPWFVFDFYKSNTDVKLKYHDVTIDSINDVLNDLMDNGEIIEDDFNHLYYFKDDYNNPNPFRWAGGKSVSQDN
jgi:hypothetical protein